MPKFVFTLATVLRVREADRDQRRSELADSQQMIEQLEDRRQALRDERTTLDREFRSSIAPGSLNADALRSAATYAASLILQVGAVEEEIAAAALRIEERREALLAADRDVRCLEKLREAHYARYLGRERSIQASLLDEVGSCVAKGTNLA